MRTLEPTLVDDVWARIQSTSGSIYVYPEAAVVQLEDPAAHYGSPIHSGTVDDVLRTI